MKSTLLILLLFIAAFASAQESRIALVIGNANYEKGKLKNPVNDALLMQSTFQNLGFDVILDTNITTRDHFYKTISTFLDKRMKYDVAFIYYAGHAVQIGGENYMLATKEEYKSERDAKNLGININAFIEDYQDPVVNKINVLIIDACRNNPFEQSWTPQNRSLENGLGLAEMKNLPTGTIIAYSTQPGYTASDGKDKNSLYCLSLAQNFMLEGVRIEDVFAKVKKEVRIASSEKQKPTYTNDLEGTAFYLKKTDLTNQIIEIDSLIEDGQNLSLIIAREKISALLALHPNDKRCLLRKGKLELYNEEIQYDGSDLFKADKLFPNDNEVKLYLARYFKSKKDFDKALKEINNSISINPDEPESYEWKFQISIESGDSVIALECLSKIIDLDKTNPASHEKRATFFIEKGDFVNALYDLNKAVELAPNEAHFYGVRADFFIQKNDYKGALMDLNNAIEIEPTTYYYNNRADFYKNYNKNNEKAIEDYNRAIQMSNDEYQKARSLNNLALIYFELEKYDLAIESYSKALELSPNEWHHYSNRADAYVKIKKFDLALNDYTKAIEIDKETPEKRFESRADFFVKQKDFTNALKDLNKAIELAEEKGHYYNNRGDFYSDYLNNKENAIEDYKTAFPLSFDNYEKARSINNLAIIYFEKETYDLAIEAFSKAIEITPNIYKPYSNRAEVYLKTNQFDLAFQDYSKAIELDTENPADRFDERADLFIQKEDYINALKDLDKAIEISPTAYYYTNRADFYNYNFNDNEKAINDYEKANEISSDTHQKARNLINLGVIYNKLEKYYLAIESFSKAIELSPEIWNSYSNRAFSYSKLEKFQLALQDYTKVIDLDKSNPSQYIARGDFYNNDLNEPIEALVDYSLAISLDSSYSRGWYRRGLLLSNKFNDHKSAIADFEYIVKLDSNAVAALNWIGVFYNRIPDEYNCIKYYNKVIGKVGTNFTDSVYSYGSIAWSFNNLGNKFKKKADKTLANKYYENAVKYDCLNPKIHDYRAWFLEHYLKNHSEALLSINKSIQLEPNNPNWHLNKAKILLNSKDFQNAEKSFKTAIEKSNKSQLYISELANFYSLTEEYSKADKLFDEAFKSDLVIASVYHLKTEHLIRQNNLTEAINTANQSQRTYKNDTVSFEQLGRIFLSKKEYLKALRAYEQALAIMEFNEGNRNFYDAIYEVYSSDIILALYEIYNILNESELACSMLAKAEISLKTETRPDNLELEEKINSLKQRCTD